MTEKPKPRTVELVRSTYRPSKAELEEPIELRKPDGSRPSPDELVRAVVQPIEIDWKRRPK